MEEDETNIYKINLGQYYEFYWEQWSETFHEYLVADAMFFPRVRNTLYLRRRKLEKYLDYAGLLECFWVKKDAFSEHVALESQNLTFANYSKRQHLFMRFIHLAKKRGVNIIIGLSDVPALDAVVFRI